RFESLRRLRGRAGLADRVGGSARIRHRGRVAARANPARRGRRGARVPDTGATDGGGAVPRGAQPRGGRAARTYAARLRSCGGCLERRGASVGGIRAAAERHGIPVAVFGHAGDGHVHVNALPDVTRPGWSDGLGALYRDAVELLLALGGTPSGEHGVGRLRAGLLERFYGPEAAALFRGFKRAYDDG